MSARSANRRIRLLLLVFAVVFAATLARVVWLQGIRAGSLEQMAARQHTQTVEIPARRGVIFDRTGVELAIGEQATTVYANPREIRDVRAVAVAAARALDRPVDELVPKLADRSRGFVYLARKADPAGADALAKEGFTGLGFFPEERRIYPQGTVGAHVIGFAGLDNRGLAGLELALDRQLAGRPGREQVVKDPFGRVIDVAAARAERHGKDVYLTLDHNIQAHAETLLADAVRRWRANHATAVVLDPRTGAVLAMAVEPGFDANEFPHASTDAQRNRAVTDTYEPGSTFKVVTVAGALAERLVRPSTRFTLPPFIQVADRVINESHGRGTETMSVAQILSRSSNVGTVTLARDVLGEQAFNRWIHLFGFGRPTGLDFPGEIAGIVPPIEDWSGSSIGNLPIGHGVAVTPIQMAAAYGAIANGGVWTRPHLVDRVRGGGYVRPQRRRVLSAQVAAQVKQMLVNVVSDDGGTGGEAAIPGYNVAGKTGTAAKPDPSGGYSKSRYVASFVGFVPAKKPELVILVAVDEPKGAIWGGVVAAPVFKQLAEFCLQYLEVPPDAPATLAPPAST